MKYSLIGGISMTFTADNNFRFTDKGEESFLGDFIFISKSILKLGIKKNNLRCYFELQWINVENIIKYAI